jgi:hypothetical protein
MQLSLIRSNNMMHTITSTANLKAAIRVLEASREVQEKELIYEIQETIERLKPRNLARTALTKITESPGVQRSFLPAFVSLATGYVSKLLVKRILPGPLKKIAGTLLQVGITAAGAKYRTELDIGFRNILLKLLGARTT